MSKGLLKLLALLFAFSMIAAACGDSDEDSGDDEGATTTTEATDDGGDETTDTTAAPDDTTDTTEDGGEPMAETVAYGNAQEFSNYNNGLASSNSVKNGIVLNEILPDPFYFAGPGGGLVMDEELMDAVNVLSTDPQVIEYVVNADAAWSDGNPIDCDDFYFAWKAYDGTQLELDENGEPAVDEESGAEIQLFQVTGNTGFDVIESVDCSDDGKTITMTYSDVFADWRATFTGLMPAHVIAAQAGVDDVVAAFDNNDRAGIEAMAEFFNNGWSMNPGELLPAELIPSGDKLMLDSWEAGSSITLVPNPNYWGTPANGPVVIRYIAEEAQAQALANGEIHAMDPQPTPDLLAQLQGIDNAVVESGSQFVWEHFDFNFNNPNLAIREVREAFALCLPRQQMVSNLIVPLDPGATILNNRFNQQFEDAYVDASGGAFDNVDLEAAQALLDASGVAQPVDIRLGWFDNGGNARRTDQVALTIQSCNQIGFNVIDSGSETFFDVELAASDWDVAMFAWAGSPLKTGSSETYRTNGGLNFTGYGNPDVDALLDAINTELDAATQADLANQVDAILWEDLVTIPVFSFPGVVAYVDNISGVVFNPSQNGLTWNASSWSVM
ncbi:MAG: ABC transporter family substrate-binding protein [Acidimicrobiales bacterium]|nr:ABC transporter family substrate-binding protein [Acidimicrobiales bacterium]